MDCILTLISSEVSGCQPDPEDYWGESARVVTYYPADVDEEAGLKE